MASEPAQTTYVVLQQLPDRSREHMPGLKGDSEETDVTSFTTPTDWREVTRVGARSAEEAIRQVADQTESAKNGSVVAIAVPLSSWKPRTIRIETVTRVKLEEA